MHSKAVTTKAGMVAIRPLRPGEKEIVESVFARLGARSRSLRFGGAKAILSDLELTALAAVGHRHHALVAYVAGDARPAGIVRFVVDEDDTSVAEVAIAVVDEHQAGGIGSALLDALAADARAGGVRTFRATIVGENRRALNLLRRVATLEDVRFDAGEIHVRAALATRPTRSLRAA